MPTTGEDAALRQRQAGNGIEADDVLNQLLKFLDDKIITPRDFRRSLDDDDGLHFVRRRKAFAFFEDRFVPIEVRLRNVRQRVTDGRNAYLRIQDRNVIQHSFLQRFVSRMLALERMDADEHLKADDRKAEPIGSLAERFGMLISDRLHDGRCRIALGLVAIAIDGEDFLEAVGDEEVHFIQIDDQDVFGMNMRDDLAQLANKIGHGRRLDVKATAECFGKELTERVGIIDKAHGIANGLILAVVENILRADDVWQRQGGQLLDFGERHHAALIGIDLEGQITFTVNRPFSSAGDEVAFAEVMRSLAFDGYIHVNRPLIQFSVSG